jgi:hypothetical protein
VRCRVRAHSVFDCIKLSFAAFASRRVRAHPVFDRIKLSFAAFASRSRADGDSQRSKSKRGRKQREQALRRPPAHTVTSTAGGAVEPEAARSWPGGKKWRYDRHLEQCRAAVVRVDTVDNADLLTYSNRLCMGASGDAIDWAVMPVALDPAAGSGVGGAVVREGRKAGVGRGVRKRWQVRRATRARAILGHSRCSPMMQKLAHPLLP